MAEFQWLQCMALYGTGASDIMLPLLQYSWPLTLPLEDAMGGNTKPINHCFGRYLLKGVRPNQVTKAAASVASYARTRQKFVV